METKKPYSQTSLDKLDALIDKFGYEKTAVKLGYSYSYIHQVHNGKLLPGKPLISTLQNLDANPRPPGIWTTWKGPEHERKMALELTMEERTEALVEKARQLGK